MRRDHAGSQQDIARKPRTAAGAGLPGVYTGRAGREVGHALRHLLRFGITSVHAFDDLNGYALFEEVRRRTGRRAWRGCPYIEIEELLPRGAALRLR